MPSFIHFYAILNTEKHLQGNWMEMSLLSNKEPHLNFRNVRPLKHNLLSINCTQQIELQAQFHTSEATTKVTLICQLLFNFYVGTNFIINAINGH